MPTKKLSQEQIVNHLKNYGFVFANSEIYNGLANAWDMGPLGSYMKNNLINLWNDYFVNHELNMFPLDSNIIYNTQVWQASGHLAHFSDPLIDCKQCHARFRADKLIEEFDPSIIVSENADNAAVQKVLDDHHINCPNCNAHDWTDIRKFNLMFQTHMGVVDDKLNTVYLRPETAQGIFINFKNVLRTMRPKLPFGIGQVGKAFRNEITPGNFIFRTREFSQMEIEYFINPETVDWRQEFDLWEQKIGHFLTKECGLSQDHLNIYDHPQDDLAHYSKKTIDYQYDFPHGMSELYGLAYRTDFDLQTHAQNSKTDLSYMDETTGKKVIPHVIEPSVGVERLLYAIWCDSLEMQDLEDGSVREVLHLPIKLAPYKVCVLPLVNKLKDQALEVLKQLQQAGIPATFEISGSIGKRYRRQDAIGTYYCLTVDFDSLDQATYTLRNRDSMEQTRHSLSEIVALIKQQLL